IDRSQPLQFRLDGRVIHGFAGDTILSTVLAAGIDTAGKRDGLALALTSRHAPAIVPATSRDPALALPMERTPATDGAAYVTLAHHLTRPPLARLLRRELNSLYLDLDRPDPLTRPWLGMAGEPGPAADLVVIGGGVAGMSAAVAGANTGLRVVLIEATPRLGGHARLFGTMDGEETPDQSIIHLSNAVAASSKITVLTSAEAFALRPGVVRLHQVQLLNGTPVGRVLDISAPRIILATGAFERLPVFSGNRLPGVVGALEAFELAHNYGVWSGKTAIIATSSSPAYRLAMLGQDAGIEVLRIIDARPQPQSRFVEFAKAYGITQAAGTVVANATPNEYGVAVSPQLAMEGLSTAEASISADRLIVCGGWQPDLTLWHMAGGESRWNAATSRLEPRSAPTGIALAGSAAGWFSRRACIDSGADADAVDYLLGNPRKPLQDQLIDPLYETPDGAAPIGDLPDGSSHPAYLDGGHGYLARPRTLPWRWPSWLPFAPKPASWSLAATPQPLDIAEVAAGVQLGAIPAASAGIVAQERVAMVGIAGPDELPPGSSDARLVPPYLIGRYDGARLFVISPIEARLLNVGTLIHADPDQTNPLNAIGVVVRSKDGAAVAYVAGIEGQTASVREPGRAIAIRLVTLYADGMDLDAALGRGASTP
ncbi:MAG: FAD-dependent oxidoreductase, partial [Devosia sp.]|nr:FAD-dependent oxidoreductase [Devosia sp.]